MGSCVSRCILGESEFPNDVDFLGNFDLERIESFFGNHVIGKSNPSGIVRVLQGDKEIDFMSFPNIRSKLEIMDITITLLCMDKFGIVYDPLNYIDDLRNQRIRIENADQKIQIEPWRIIRVLRFVASFGYEVEGLTKEACIKNASLMDPENENTKYTLGKLRGSGVEVTQKVLQIAEEFGILGFVSNLIADGRKYE